MLRRGNIAELGNVPVLSPLSSLISEYHLLKLSIEIPLPASPLKSHNKSNMPQAEN
jgi:hypothetical protein